MTFHGVECSFLVVVAVATLAVCRPEGPGAGPIMTQEDSVTNDTTSSVGWISQSSPLDEAYNQTHEESAYQTPPPWDVEPERGDYQPYQSPLIHQNSEIRKKRSPTYCSYCGNLGSGGGWSGGGGWRGDDGCGSGGCGTTKIIVVPVTVQKQSNDCGNGCGPHHPPPPPPPLRNNCGSGCGPHHPPPPPPPPSNNCGSGCCTGNCGGSKSYSSSYATASASASSYSYEGVWGKK